MQRYMFAYEAFSSYASNRVQIGVREAINITSILGDKGQTAYQCQDNNSGSNILSVTFHPAVQTAYVSWESASRSFSNILKHILTRLKILRLLDGMGAAWRPATCNIYVKVDFSQFW